MPKFTHVLLRLGNDLIFQIYVLSIEFMGRKIYEPNFWWVLAGRRTLPHQAVGRIVFKEGIEIGINQALR